mmetsp:Transcript_103628/g.288489  ORF Transcript_103628/g.288489 Transcript_103628/m.288489 type:complete len:370 (+) Transcript_103628:67-1176(+)
MQKSNSSTCPLQHKALPSLMLSSVPCCEKLQEALASRPQILFVVKLPRGRLPHLVHGTRRRAPKPGGDLVGLRRWPALQQSPNIEALGTRIVIQEATTSVATSRPCPPRRWLRQSCRGGACNCRRPREGLKPGSGSWCRGVITNLHRCSSTRPEDALFPELGMCLVLPRVEMLAGIQLLAVVGADLPERWPLRSSWWQRRLRPHRHHCCGGQRSRWRDLWRSGCRGRCQRPQRWWACTGESLCQLVQELQPACKPLVALGLALGARPLLRECELLLSSLHEPDRHVSLIAYVSHAFREPGHTVAPRHLCQAFLCLRRCCTDLVDACLRLLQRDLLCSPHPPAQILGLGLEIPHGLRARLVNQRLRHKIQ